MILDKYRLPLFQAPEATEAVADTAAAPPPATTDTSPTEPQPSSTAPSSESAVEPAKAPPPRWMLDRIAEETRKRQEIERDYRDRIALLERQKSEAEALAARMQRGADAQGQPTLPVREEPRIDENQFRSEVQRAAAQQRLIEDSLQVKNAGIAQFGAQQFQESLRVLGAIGATSDEFVSDVLAVDKANAHVLLDKLAKDPERAVTLSNMDSRARIAELARMNMAAKPDTAQPTQPAAGSTKQVSKAPPPPPAIEPTTEQKTPGYADKASDEEFNDWFFNHHLKRKMRR